MSHPVKRMIKRRPFFIRGNIQLVFILGYVVILSAGILCAAAMIYYHLKEILEGAVFSSHLNLESSEQLFWATIFKINFLIAGASIAGGFIAITTAYFYLEAFFASISAGLDAMARKDTSVRLRPRRLWGTRSLVHEFNEAAVSMEREEIEVRRALEAILLALDSPTRESFRSIRNIQASIENRLSE